MRTRHFIVALAATTVLAACSSSTKGSGNGGGLSSSGGGASSTSAPTGGSSGGGNAALCAQLAQASQELGNASGALANPATAKQAFENAIAKLKLIGSGAPANVTGAVNDLISLLQGAEAAYGNPQAPDVSKLQALSTKLPADIQTISTYVGANCAHS